MWNKNKTNDEDQAKSKTIIRFWFSQPYTYLIDIVLK